MGCTSRDDGLRGSGVFGVLGRGPATTATDDNSKQVADPGDSADADLAGGCESGQGGGGSLREVLLGRLQLHV